METNSNRFEETSSHNLSSILQNFAIDNLDQYVNDIKSVVSDTVESAKTFVQENPIYTVLGAAALGYSLAGMIRESGIVAKSKKKRV